jgi:hypothetical protein
MVIEIQRVESANTNTLRVVTKKEQIPTVKLYFNSNLMFN